MRPSAAPGSCAMSFHSRRSSRSYGSSNAMDNDEVPAPDEASPAGKTDSLGRTLRAAREARRLSLERASELLRIEPKFLVALEEERFDAIGPPVFVKGYLRHYSELLGLDARALIDAHRDEIGKDEPNVRARRSLGHERERSVAAWVMAVAGVALAAALLWLVGLPILDVPEDEAAVVASEIELDAPASPFAGREAPSDSAPARGVTDADVPPVRVVPLEEPARSDASDASSAGPATDLGSGGEEANMRPDAAGVDVPLGDDLSLASPEPGLRGAGEAEDPAGGRMAAHRLEIELRFVEDSWTEVTSEDDERLFYGLARAGAEERVRADTPVTVLLGNADGVVVRVNGEAFSYPRGSRRGDLARFTLRPPQD